MDEETAAVLTEERVSDETDVLIVGGGPAGLATAIRLKQLAEENSADLGVTLVEKGAEVGSHTLSGVVFEPRAMDELLPHWREAEDTPLHTKAAKDDFFFLTKGGAIPLPVPPVLHNEGNYIGSLGNVVRWLGEQAEGMGVEVYAGINASELVYSEDGSVKGIATGDMGLDKAGMPSGGFERGMELHAKQTVFAEGCRGHLSKELMEVFSLRENCDPQTYGIGLKEVWEVPEELHKPGYIMHTVGYPSAWENYCGSFLYHWNTADGARRVSCGLVVGLDYTNPYTNPYLEFQAWKMHPKVRANLEGGSVVSYGARAISEGGIQSMPSVAFPGGVLVGDAAGMLNMPKIKGSHTAMKSGILAAESIWENLNAGETQFGYSEALNKSWVVEELHTARNVHPGFHLGSKIGLSGLNTPIGMMYAALDSMVLRGKAPWTMKQTADHDKLKPAAECTAPNYPKPDGIVGFDLLTSVSRSGTNHREDQPPHLTLKDASVPVDINLAKYDGPEGRYCPAGVYEYVRDDDGSNPRLVINAQNCVHCKTCDIKDPTQNIDWTVPEGGGGPKYTDM